MNSVSRTISDETLSRIIDIESSGNPNIRARTSTATGLNQFLNATWLATVKKHRPDLMDGRSSAQVLALRTDPKLSIELGARFAEDNARVLGKGWTDGDLYLAHFSGVGVAKQLLRADPSDPCSLYYSDAAIKANASILRGKTVGQVRAWANRKMAGARTHWVAKFLGAAVPLPKPKPAPVPDDPGPEPEPDIDPVPIKQGWFRSFGSKVKAGLGAVGFTGLAYLTDWQIAAAFFGFVLILIGISIAVFFWIFDAEDVRAWIRKQCA